jgi:hypothetical protein
MTDFLMERGLQTLVVAFSENEPVATFRRLTKPCSFSSDILIRSALDRGGPRTSKLRDSDLPATKEGSIIASARCSENLRVSMHPFL